jgi:NAD-dependent SIR2 family protein deacetylase
MFVICVDCQWQYYSEYFGQFLLETTPDCPRCEGFMEGFRIL